jgi:D-aminopeptidase
MRGIEAVHFMEAMLKKNAVEDLTGVRARDVGLACGDLEPGPRNAITDVPGVLVGHKTLVRGSDIRTGVTAVVPLSGNVFRERPFAAVDVLNGFGKSFGLMYVTECGILESPILLTNTFSVPTCANALIRQCIKDNPETGREASTVNPLVLECNDGYLNDIQAISVTESDALDAISAAGTSFASGSVGAGTGMSCFGLKGGIGTASRRILDGYPTEYFLGTLVLANFGRRGDLRLPNGRRIAITDSPQTERGSIIVLVATNAPLEYRQLRRVSRRAGAGIAWCGSHFGHGSGDVFVAFSTANKAAVTASKEPQSIGILNEQALDNLFEACAEATQEAVLDALAAAEPMVGFAGHHRPSLRQVM